MSEAIETYEHAGITVEIHPDQHLASSPREWSNVSMLYVWDERISGVCDEGERDETFHPSDHDTLEDAILALIARGAKVILPLYLLDHSGYALSSGPNLIELDNDGRARACTGKDRFVGDAEGWDTTMCGFAWANQESQDVCGTPDDALLKCVEEEISTLDDYFQGNVYGYIVAPDGEAESCWDFYGFDYCKKEANDMAEHIAAEREKEAAEAAYWRAREVVTV
jgi:hypothetical protein